MAAVVLAVRPQRLWRLGRAGRRKVLRLDCLELQRADKQDKPIVELRQQARDPEFRGFLQFHRGLDEVDALPASWTAALRNVRGIYLIVHRTTGKQYVGSATGAGGFVGRWVNYASGHGGNVGMKELGASAAAFDVAILEVAGSDASADDIFARETLWKDKLGSKVTGLNRN